MDYLKPDEIGKFKELVEKLKDTLWQLRLVTKRMDIKVAQIDILNFDDFDYGWQAHISSYTNSDADNYFTSFKADFKDGNLETIISDSIQLGGKK